jgi:hypothetical protein
MTLRLVTGETTIDGAASSPFIRQAGDPLFDEPRPPVKASWMERSRERFARVLAKHLADRRADRTFHARARLYCLLMIESREGRRPVRLTNAMADGIGLTRFQKLRHLQRLEEDGLVVIARDRNATPIVTFLGYD